MAGHDEQTRGSSPLTGLFFAALNEALVGSVPGDDFPEQLTYFLDAFLIEQIETGGFRPVMVGGMAGDLNQIAD